MPNTPCKHCILTISAQMSVYNGASLDQLHLFLAVSFSSSKSNHVPDYLQWPPRGMAPFNLCPPAWLLLSLFSLAYLFLGLLFFWHLPTFANFHKTEVLSTHAQTWAYNEFTYFSHTFQLWYKPSKNKQGKRCERCFIRMMPDYLPDVPTGLISFTIDTENMLISMADTLSAFAKK